jgi:hypothetical protein
VDSKVLVNCKIETWHQVIKTIANLLAFIHFISHNEKTCLNDNDEQPIFCEVLESLLRLMSTTRVLNWAESTTEQAPHMPYTFLLRIHNLFATFCDLALDSSAQARGRKSATLEPEDLPLLTDIYVLVTELQIALAAASKNNTLGCFNEIPLTYKLHCIKAISKEEPKRAKKRDRDTEHDHNDFDKGTTKDNTDKGFFCLKVGSTSFDQHLPQLPMVSAIVKGTIKQRKVCKDYCTRGFACTQRRCMFLHVTDISHIKDQAERQATMATFAENHPQIKLAPGQSNKVRTTPEGPAPTLIANAAPANNGDANPETGETSEG